MLRDVLSQLAGFLELVHGRGEMVVLSLDRAANADYLSLTNTNIFYHTYRTYT